MAAGGAQVITGIAGLMVKILVTGVAAAILVSPGWVAVTEQLPGVVTESVVPETPQTAGVLETNATGRAELAVAASVNGATPKLTSPGEAKLMLCASGTKRFACAEIAAFIVTVCGVGGGLSGGRVVLINSDQNCAARGALADIGDTG
jgi:hypothetical protein